ncbi:hypothetical protein A500_00110, partial [Clostridium sartagoforme AAU1]
TSIVISDYKYIIIIFIPILIAILLRYTKISIFLIIMVNESMFYLLDNFNANAFMTLLTIILVFCSFYEIVIKGKKVKYLFRNNIIMIFIIVLIEVFIAHSITNQSIFLGVDASKRYFWYANYFYLRLKINNDNADEIIDFVIKIATILSVLYLMQSLLYTKIQVFNMNYLEKYPFVRFYTGITIIVFSLFLSLERFKYTKRKKYLFFSFIMILEIVFVGQSRSIIIPLFILIFYKIFMFIRNKFTAKSLIVATVLFVTFTPMLFNSNSYINKMIDSVFKEISMNTGTSGVRVREVEFFLNQFKEYPLLGCGIHSDKTDIGLDMLGRNYKFFQNDIGVLGFIATFGVIGIGVFLSIAFKMIIYIYRFKKKNLIIYGELSIVYILISLPLSFYFENSTSILYILITLCYFENYLEKYIDESDILNDRRNIISFDKEVKNEF